MTAQRPLPLADTLRQFFAEQGVRFELMPHVPAGTSTRVAETAHVPGVQLGKAVVVENAARCAVVVMPATDQVHLGGLRRQLGDTWALATEAGVERVFPDCAHGSIPALGQAYGLPVLVDERLLEQDPVYLESGDPASLVRPDGADFRRLMQDARAGRYGDPA